MGESPVEYLASKGLLPDDLAKHRVAHGVVGEQRNVLRAGVSFFVHESVRIDKMGVGESDKL